MAFFIVELIGTVAFAISGVLVGVRRELDLFGVVTLGLVTAVGGGVIRDVVIGQTPPAALRDPVYSLIAIGVSLLFFFLFYWRKIPAEDAAGTESATRRRMELLLFLADTLGLAAFTVLGIESAVENGAGNNLTLLLFIGVITGVGGGVLRDLLAGLVPKILRKHIYALASLGGALTMALLLPLLPAMQAALAGAVVVIVLRLLAFRGEWNLPRVKQ